MKEPKTIADAIKMTLAKIEECVKLPIKNRYDAWYKTKWYRNTYGKQFCAFCIVADSYNSENPRICGCIVINICQWFEKNVRPKFRIKDLRKLYRKVEEIEA